MANDPINPDHYKANPFFECIELTERYGFDEGNCIKYLFRLHGKGHPLEDARKALWYADRAVSTWDSDFKTIDTSRRPTIDMEAASMLHQLELADWQGCAIVWHALGECELGRAEGRTVLEAVRAVAASLETESDVLD